MKLICSKLLLLSLITIFTQKTLSADDIDRMIYQGINIGHSAPLNTRYKDKLIWLKEKEEKPPYFGVDAAIGNNFFPNFSSDQLSEKPADKVLNPYVTLSGTFESNKNLELAYRPTQGGKFQYTYYAIQWLPVWATLFMPYAFGVSFSVGGAISNQMFERTQENLRIKTQALDGTFRIHVGSLAVIFLIDFYVGLNVAVGKSDLESNTINRESRNQSFQTLFFGLATSIIPGHITFGFDSSLNLNSAIPRFGVFLSACF